MNNHIVPQVYLNQFTGKGKKIFKIKVDEKYPKNILREWFTSEIGYKKDFYTIYDLDFLKSLGIEDKDYLEKNGFKWYENKLDSIVKKIKKRQNYLTPTDAEILIRGLLHIKQRNDYHRINFPKDYFINLVKQKTIDVIETWEKSNEALIREALDFMDKKEQEWTNNNNFVNDNQNKLLIGESLQKNTVLNDIATLCLQCQWIILETTIKNLFITSDNPGFCMDKQEIIHNTNFQGDFSFLFPLTPLHCLLIRHELQDNVKSIKSLQFQEFNPEGVRLTNISTCTIANKEIYSGSQETIQKAWVNFHERKNQIKNL
jgi:hypothetical protein